MNLIQPIVNVVRNTGINACEKRALYLAKEFKGNLINIGGGHSSEKRWWNAINIDAEYGDRIVDFNTCPIPVEDSSFENAVCEQVIEHLHNTTWFLSECNRILRLGGHFLIATENLGSLPNLFALICGKAPFSTQAVCGKFVNGFRELPANPDCTLPMNAPAFSGCRGHVRVMTKGQLKVLLKDAGFKVLSSHSFAFNHYILFHCIKIS